MIRIFKITLGVLLALLVTELLGFGRDVTAPMVVVLVIALSPAVHATKGQARSVLFSNLIGIFLGIVLPMFIHNYIIAVTLATFLSMYIAYLLPWNISFVTSTFATMIIISMGVMEAPIRYGEYRIFLVFLGVFIGYIVKNFFIPPNYGKLVHEGLKEHSQKMLSLTKDFLQNNTEIKKYKNALADFEGQMDMLNQHSYMFEQDLILNKGYLRKYETNKETYDALHILIKVNYYILYKLIYFQASFLSLEEDLQKEIINTHNNLMVAHENLLDCFYGESKDSCKIPNLSEQIATTGNYHEIVFKGSLVEYCLELNKLKELLKLQLIENTTT
jgi:uncharacterized membrane protein YgaE (UPF0421/DUF939 family)